MCWGKLWSRNLRFILLWSKEIRGLRVHGIRGALVSVSHKRRLAPLQWWPSAVFHPMRHPGNRHCPLSAISINRGERGILWMPHFSLYQVSTPRHRREYALSFPSILRWFIESPLWCLLKQKAGKNIMSRIHGTQQKVRRQKSQKPAYRF